MEITELSVQGFRSLKNVVWKPGKLNVVIGPNGSGKSNLLRMLEMISSAAQGSLTDYILEQGGFETQLWDGRAKSIAFSLRAQHGVKVKAYDVLFTCSLDKLSFPAYQVSYESLVDMSNGFDHITRNGKNLNVYAVLPSGERRVVTYDQEQVSPEELMLSVVGRPWNNNLTISDFQDDATSWAIYQAIRTDAEAALRLPPVARREDRVASGGQNLINVLHTLYTGDREFKRQVNTAMRAACGDDFDELIFPPASDQRIQLRVRWKTLKREQSAADLSDGTLRFLFLLAVLASPSPPSLIAIDEPETGLHPSMLPLVAELAVDAAERTQVVFTTHSDQFLDAFRGTATQPTTTVAKWENGETTLTTLSDEELAYWLKDYSLGHLFRSGELENLAA